METYPFAAQALAFYLEIAAFQKSLADDLKSALGSRLAQSQDVPFRDGLALASVLPNFRALLLLVKREGTPVLAEAAEALARENVSYWEYLLSSYWQSEGHGVSGAPETQLFFAQAFLQPYAESLASSRKVELPRLGTSCCPICTGKPLVGVLREEGYGAKRSLVCSLCLTEWDYRRVLCPACGEEQFDALPVYTASQIAHVCIQACDTCKTYIKTVDLTKNGLAIPEVDELAAVPLGLWAQENGYTKLQPNLLGM